MLGSFMLERSLAMYKISVIGEPLYQKFAVFDGEMVVDSGNLLFVCLFVRPSIRIVAIAILTHFIVQRAEKLFMSCSTY